MPTAVGHVAQAGRNEDVSRIVQESHPEWAVTALRGRESIYHGTPAA